MTGLAALLAVHGWVPYADAQSAPMVSRPVVQPLGNAGVQELNAALARLGSNPRDVAALADAGRAAGKMGDLEAAIGFYRRAEQIEPRNAGVQAGLGSALALSGDPVDAIAAFGAAEKAGASLPAIAADRALAYDLIGDNLTAQRYYAMAPRGGANENELRLRLALSQAIGGDAAGSEQTLLPLLRQQDKPAWRTRAFALAIAGDTKQAVDVVQTILPGALSEQISPYLRYMPRLTRAQQAAAANLGKFPRASEIGRDDAKIAAITPAGGFPRREAPPAQSVALGSADGSNGGGGKARARAKDRRSKAAEAAQAAQADKARLAAVASERARPPEPAPAIARSDEASIAQPRTELPPLRPANQVAGAVAGTPVQERAVQERAAQERAAQERAGPARVAVASGAPLASGPVKGYPARGGFDLATLPSGGAPATGTVVSASASPSAPSPASGTPAPAPMPTTLVPTTPALTAGTPAAIVAAPSSRPPSTVPSTPTALLAASSAASPSPPASFPPASSPAGTGERPKRAPGTAPATLAQAFAGLDKPSLHPVPAPGAVDLRQIAATRAEAKPAEKPAPKKKAPPAHPSRIWVQLGVGRNKSAIVFDWKRMARKAPGLLKGKGPYVSDFGQTNRILAGPFESQRAADSFLQEVVRSGAVDGALPWTSPAGQVVDLLSAN